MLDSVKTKQNENYTQLEPSCWNNGTKAKTYIRGILNTWKQKISGEQVNAWVLEKSIPPTLIRVP